jgi:hypothetical protein
LELVRTRSSARWSGIRRTYELQAYSNPRAGKTKLGLRQALREIDEAE